MADDLPKFDMKAAIERIDRRQAKIYADMERTDRYAKYEWLWFLFPFLPIAVGVWIAVKL